MAQLLEWTRQPLSTHCWVQRLFVQGLGRYGCMGAVLVGDKLYGYRGGLLARVEGVGWLPVVWMAPSLRQRVRAQSRLRALGRLERYGWALRERYRIEQVFGSVKRAYGSYLGCRGAERGVERVGVWGVGVEWLLCVGWVDGWGGCRGRVQWAFGCQRACGVCSRLLEMADASGSPAERGEPRTGSVPPARRGEARRGWVNLTRAGRWART